MVVNDLGGAVDGTGADVGAAQLVVDEITAAGGEAVADANSVATPEGGAAIVQTAIDAFGRIDIVVNNAGILRDKSFSNMNSELLDPVIDVHLRGAFHVTQPAWQHMREQNYGRIVSTSSSSGLFGNFGQTNYGAAKMGLVGFTRVLAVEGAKYGIKANAIAPLALTRMTEPLLGPLGEKVAPERVSPLVAYLAHESCEATGRVFSVGGGRDRRGVHRRDPGLPLRRADPRARRRELGRRSPIATATSCRPTPRTRPPYTRRRCPDLPSFRSAARRVTDARAG